jgi:transposase
MGLSACQGFPGASVQMNDQSLPIEITDEEMETFLRRVEEHCLLEKDFDLIKTMAESIRRIRHVLQEKDASIGRLVKMIFGAKTESAKNILKKIDKESSSDKSEFLNPSSPKKEKKKGHGRNGKKDYPGVQKKQITHPEFSPGTLCPGCLKGKLYHVEPGVLLRFTGTAPIQGTVYELEKYRCNLCGEIFSAREPEEAGDKKYDETVAPTIAILKYGNGFPFYRLEQLQKSYGIPLPASTQWEILQTFAKIIYPVYPALMEFAAQGSLFHNDDTPAKILSLLKDMNLAQENPERKGLFTTGVISVLSNKKMALFFTGNKHAGENLEDLLRKRKAELSPPIQMCDALSRNLPKDLMTILANCMAHARRNFVDIFYIFPEQCRHVIETLGEVYHYDDLAKEKNMDHYDRLGFHKEHSAPLMEGLKEWLNNQIEEKKAEPNSSLGKAINYMLNHWEPLTLFLRIPGAPLDNNIVERALKRAILHRKNSLFFKTKNGASVGDLFMSLIHTCHLSGVNPFHYLTTLHRHSSELHKNPEKWLPWNYQLAVE